MAEQEQIYFRSDGKVYEIVEVDQISLRDLITFPRDAEEVLGKPMTWAEAQAMSQEVAALPPKERDDHPMGPFVLAVVIWASRRAAGDTITFSEALDASFEWVETKRPQDHKPGKRQGAKKAPAKKAPAKKTAKRPTRPGSARGNAAADRDRQET